MCNNSELRALYDLYSQQDIPWIHDSEYHATLERRSSFGMLSMQFWLMMIDGCILSPILSLSQVNAILKQCCKAPAAILERRRAVLQSANYYGVWTFDLPDHSPYRARSVSLFSFFDQNLNPAASLRCCTQALSRHTGAKAVHSTAP